MSRHAHVQIQYHDQDDQPRESLVGFNPISEEDRQLVHAMLDEYIDEYLVPKFQGEPTVEGEDDRFIVFKEIDDH